MGDIVATPLGDLTVIEVNWSRSTFFTQDPSSGLVLEWKNEEVEEIAHPDPDEGVEALERWLRVKAVIVPSLEVETDTIRCNANDCPCGLCYRIVKRLSARGAAPRVEITHHKDNEVCACDFDGGSAASVCGCLDTVNIRWVFPGFQRP